MRVMTAEACFRDEVAVAVATLVVAANHEEEEEEVLAAGSGAVCSGSQGRMPLHEECPQVFVKVQHLHSHPLAEGDARSGNSPAQRIAASPAHQCSV